MERIQNLLVRLLVEKKAQVVQMYNHQLTPQLSYSFCFYITLEEKGRYLRFLPKTLSDFHYQKVVAEV